MFCLLFQKKLTPGTPKTPKKDPKTPKNVKINNFQNMSCGVSLERYGSGEQFLIVSFQIALSQNEVSEIKLKRKK